MGRNPGNSFIDRLERSACRLRLAFEAAAPKTARGIFSDTAIHFMPSPDFENYDQFDAEDRQVYDRLVFPHEAPRPTGGLEPVYGYHSTPLLTRRDETCLLRRMNYLKFLASQEVEQIRKGARGVLPRVARIRDLLFQANAIRNHLIQANTRLIRSIVGDDEAGAATVRLIEAIEKFDYTRGNKLSTLATVFIRNDAIRRFHQEQKHTRGTQASEGLLALFTSGDSGFQAEGDAHLAQATVERAVAELAQKNERSARLIALRFGLDGTEPLTLKEIGTQLGVTKERVRQLEKDAFSDLRAILSGQELPEDLH